VTSLPGGLQDEFIGSIFGNVMDLAGRPIELAIRLAVAVPAVKCLPKKDA
jgi:hypothetical protein